VKTAKREAPVVRARDRVQLGRLRGTVEAAFADLTLVRWDGEVVSAVYHRPVVGGPAWAYPRKVKG
jgi:hypothetical protein